MGIPAALLPLMIKLDETNSPVPEDKDVVAGWAAFGIFLGVAALVAFLGWSLTRQLKKVRRAREEGVFGEDAIPHDDTDGDDTGSAER